MNPLVGAWVEKAEEDWRVANREMRVRRGQAFAVVCFHAQQCAEKYLKALLLELAVAFPKVHDLLALRSLIPRGRSAVRGIRRPRLVSLSRAAVEYRYPGGRVSRRLAIAALSTAADVRQRVRRELRIAGP